MRGGAANRSSFVFESQYAFGTLEDARALIGRDFIHRKGAIGVSEALIQLFCSVTEDANSSFWDRDFATAQWGGILSPPAMLMAWLSPLPWTPGGGEIPRQGGLAVPLPGNRIINAVHESWFYEPIRVGDRLSITEQIAAVSDLKESHLGPGHFVTTNSRIVRQDGVEVAGHSNQVLRYTPWTEKPQAKAKPARPAAAAEAPAGNAIPDLTMKATRLKAVFVPATTLDIMEGHYDPDSVTARQSGGLSFNTFQILGLFNRHVTDWAGPRTFVRHQQIRVIRPFLEGTTGTVSGRAIPDEGGEPGRFIVVAALRDDAGTDYATCKIALSVLEGPFAR